ncbi:MAG: hypothetical protein H7Z38_02355 [Rubrivivax sp.]|nr:hypothetical protein [Pyrinomonadaceae bacterium]
MQKKWMGLTLALALTGSALGVCAQETKVRRPGTPPPAEAERDVLIVRQGPDGPPPPARGVEMHGDNFVFLATEMSFNGKVVKGAPYSAQAVTESVQMLADGNRIVHKNTAQVYRDSEGRTRRDQSLGAIGPYAAQGDPPQTFFINDPVAGANYILDPRSKIARKLPRMEFRFKTVSKDGVVVQEDIEGKLSAESHARARVKKEGDESGFAFTIQTPPPGDPAAGADVQFFRHSSKADRKTEKLEARNVEGVQAEGSRTTTTIPAGELGNEQPIQVVDERWYSPDLQVVVMTRHSDPRFGETTYKLTNIQRGEPSAALFQVPSDYTLKESRPHGPAGQRRMRRPASPPPSQDEN